MDRYSNDLRDESQEAIQFQASLSGWRRLNDAYDDDNGYIEFQERSYKALNESYLVVASFVLRTRLSG